MISSIHTPVFLLNNFCPDFYKVKRISKVQKESSEIGQDFSLDETVSFELKLEGLQGTFLATNLILLKN